jgi:hypothetical protein
MFKLKALDPYALVANLFSMYLIACLADPLLQAVVARMPRSQLAEDVEKVMPPVVR